LDYVKPLTARPRVISNSPATEACSRWPRNTTPTPTGVSQDGPVLGNDSVAANEAYINLAAYESASGYEGPDSLLAVAPSYIDLSIDDGLDFIDAESNSGTYFQTNAGGIANADSEGIGRQVGVFEARSAPNPYTFKSTQTIYFPEPDSNGIPEDSVIDYLYVKCSCNGKTLSALYRPVQHDWEIFITGEGTSYEDASGLTDSFERIFTHAGVASGASMNYDLIVEHVLDSGTDNGEGIVQHVIGSSMLSELKVWIP
jgi:hypothetical protein